MPDLLERALRVDTRDVSVGAIRAAAYRFGDTFSVSVEPAEEHAVSVRCVFTKRSPAPDVDSVMSEFMRELNDQVLRERVREETKHLRAVIMAHAFSRTTLGKDG